jgi:hypothetical protein
MFRTLLPLINAINSQPTTITPPTDEDFSNMDNLISMIKYFAAIVVDGDYLNDWVTHLPEVIRPDIIEMGQALAQMFGY